MIYSEHNQRVKNKIIKTYEMSQIYAHGKLEYLLNGHDSIVTDDKQLYDLIRNPKEDKIIMDLQIINQNNNIYDVVAFLWRKSSVSFNDYIGLVCLKDDEVYIKHAKEKYNKMEQFF